MSTLTPLRQRPATAVRRRGQLVVPRKPPLQQLAPHPTHALRIDPVGTQSLFAGYSANVDNWPVAIGAIDTSGWTGAVPTAALADSGNWFTVTFGANGVDQYGTTTRFAAALQGFGLFTLTWNGFEYVSGLMPGIWGYMNGISGQGVNLNLEPQD